MSEGPIAGALMRSLGYRARVKYVGSKLYYFSDKGLGNPRSRVQAGISSWFADYPGASSFIEFFSCKGFAHFCDPRIEALIQRARTLPRPLTHTPRTSSGHESITPWWTELPLSH